MSSAKRLIIVSLATASLAASAWAGGSGYAANESSNDPWTAIAYKVRPREKRANPLQVAGRVAETFLHWPRIFAETLYGERPLVSKKGVLALRETPIEEQIYSPGE